MPVTDFSSVNFLRPDAVAVGYSASQSTEANEQPKRALPMDTTYPKIESIYTYDPGCAVPGSSGKRFKWRTLPFWSLTHRASTHRPASIPATLILAVRAIPS